MLSSPSSPALQSAASVTKEEPVPDTFALKDMPEYVACAYNNLCNTGLPDSIRRANFARLQDMADTNAEVITHTNYPMLSETEITEVRQAIGSAAYMISCLYASPLERINESNGKLAKSYSEKAKELGFTAPSPAPSLSWMETLLQIKAAAAAGAERVFGKL